MTDPGCICCARPLRPEERACCQACVTRVRGDLTDIADCYTRLPGDVERWANAPVPGGPAMVMLAPGSSGIGQWRAHCRGADSTHDEDEIAGELGSVGFELGRWEDDWRRLRGHPPALVPAASTVAERDVQRRMVTAAVAYLGRHLGWAAAQQPEFDVFASDMHRLRVRLQLVTATGDFPEVGVPCFDCGGRLQRGWTDAGRVDDWTCSACKRRYDDASYWLAVKASYIEAVG